MHIHMCVIFVIFYIFMFLNISMYIEIFSVSYVNPS